MFIAGGMVGPNRLRVAAHAMALGIGLHLIPLAAVASAVQVAFGRAPVSWAVIRPHPAARRLLVGACGLVVLYARTVLGSRAHRSPA